MKFVSRIDTSAETAHKAVNGFITLITLAIHQSDFKKYLANSHAVTRHITNNHDSVEGSISIELSPKLHPTQRRAIAQDLAYFIHTSVNKLKPSLIQEHNLQDDIMDTPAHAIFSKVGFTMPIVKIRVHSADSHLNEVRTAMSAINELSERIKTCVPSIKKADAQVGAEVVKFLQDAKSLFDKLDKTLTKN